MDAVHFYVPRNLPISGDLYWPCAYITHLCYHGLTGFKSDGCARISRHWMRKMLGRAANSSLELLTKKRVIERVGCYEPGDRSFGYRLLPEYMDVQFVECGSRKIARKIVEVHDAGIPVVNWLAEHAKTLSIDYEPAMESVPHLPPRRHEETTEETMQAAIAAINVMRNHCPHFILDRRQGRVFSAHVNMHSGLRQFWRSPDGHQIVGVDVRNCQPLLLSLVAAAYYHDRQTRSRLLNYGLDEKQSPYLWPQVRTWGSGLSVSKIFDTQPFGGNDLRHDVRHVQDTASPCPSPSSVDSRVSRVPSSVVAWLRLCESGRLYESFGVDRERVKLEFILTMFGRRPLSSFEVGRKLLDRFSDIVSVIEDAKTRNALSKRNDKRPHRFLSCLLQLVESTLMIYRVCGRIMRERPSTPVWTIHDSIYTSAPHLDYVRGVLLDEFAKVNIAPSLKEEWL